MLMSIVRAGYTVFPISPRNSAAAVAHLIDKVDVKCVFVGRDVVTTDLAQEAMKSWDKQHPKATNPLLSPMPIFEDLFRESEDDPDDIPYEKPKENDIIFYVHSSGKSAASPILLARWTNHCILQALHRSRNLFRGHTSALRSFH